MRPWPHSKRSSNSKLERRTVMSVSGSPCEQHINQPGHQAQGSLGYRSKGKDGQRQAASRPAPVMNTTAHTLRSIAGIPILHHQIRYPRLSAQVCRSAESVGCRQIRTFTTSRCVEGFCRWRKAICDMDAMVLDVGVLGWCDGLMRGKAVSSPAV